MTDRPDRPAARPGPGVRDLAAAVRAGRIGPHRAVDDALDATIRRDGVIRACTRIDVAGARAAAAALAARADLDRLPLAGVPFAVKQYTDPADPLIRRLTDAGAVAVAETAAPQYCTWGATDRPGRVVANPTRPGRTPGGSSGGAAAAVAAGMVPFAHGNDGMGSLRIPAAACGLATLKATPGLLPGRIGRNDWYGMSVHGVLARDVADLRLLTRVLTAGAVDVGPGAAIAPEVVLLDPSSPVAGIPVRRGWAAAAAAAAGRFRRAGVPVLRARAPYPANPLPMLARWTAGVADSVADDPGAGASGVDAHLEWRTRVHAGLGRLLRPTIADGQVTRARAAMAEFLPEGAVLITPALAADPPRAGAWHRRPWAANLAANMRFSPFTSVWNLLGHPAGVVVEPGTGRGVQVIARPGGEALVLSAMDRISGGGSLGA